MTDVVLIDPPYWKRKGRETEQPKLGLGYLASYLELHGISVEIVDALVHQLSPQEIAHEVKSLKPNIVGITGCTDDRLGVIQIIKSIRTFCNNVLIVGGGPHFSYTAEDALRNISELDIVVIGEGEIPFLNIVEEYSKRFVDYDFSKIDSIVYRDTNGEIKRSSHSISLIDVNKSARPAWHLFDMNSYSFRMSQGAPYRAIGIISSRGCPYSCAFCANSLSKRLRLRKPTDVVDEIEFLMDKFGFTAFNFLDDSFAVNRKHVVEICNEIIKRRLSIKWYCGMRVDNADKDLLRLMKEAGCVALGFGIEFASNEILKRIHKGTSVEMIHSAFKNVSEIGFPHVSTFFLNSFPGQNRINTIESHINFNKLQEVLRGRYPFRVFRGSLVRCYPGTEISAIAKQQKNVFPTNFSWNTYYRNPLSKKDKKWLLGCWSTPHYEDERFTVPQIKETLNEIEAYFIIEQIRFWSKNISNFFNKHIKRNIKDLARIIIKQLPSLNISIVRKWKSISEIIKREEIRQYTPKD